MMRAQGAIVGWTAPSGLLLQALGEAAQACVAPQG
jgi:hypothetical protein